VTPYVWLSLFGEKKMKKVLGKGKKNLDFNACT
jgi:hypothetical protein